MRKIVIAIIAILSSKVAFALPSGNPAEPGFYISRHCNDHPCCFLPLTSHVDFFNYGWGSKFDFRIGYYGDFVYNRNLEKATGTREDLHNFILQTNAGYLAITFCDLLELYGTVGASKMELGGTNTIFRMGIGSNSPGSFQTDSALSWSLGARTILLEWREWTLGAQGQYFRTAPNLKKYVNTFDTRATYINGESIVYKEWQGSVGLSYISQINDSTILSPYIAVTASNAYFDGNNISFINVSAQLTRVPDFNSNKIVGYAVGISLVTYDLVSVTVEGRWINENALYVNGNIRF